MIVVACTPRIAALLQNILDEALTLNGLNGHITFTTDDTLDELIRLGDDVLSPQPGLTAILDALIEAKREEDMKRCPLTTSVVAGLAATKGIASTCNAVELNPDGIYRPQRWQASPVPSARRNTGRTENYTGFYIPRRRFQRHR